MEKREIKFRCWDKKKKKMIFPHSIYLPNSGNLSDFGKDIIFMLFTGLKDNSKPPKEIYEGDIVEYEKLSFEVCRDSWLCMGLLGFREKGRGFRSFSELAGSKMDITDLKVIGNIYEKNPDLLK